MPEGTSTADSKMTGLRSRLMAMQAQAATASTGLPNQNTPGATANPQGEDSTRLTLRLFLCSFLRLVFASGI